MHTAGHATRVACCVLLLLGSPLIVSPCVASDFAVVGYLPEYRLGGFNYSAAFDTGLTHLLFFSLEIDSRGSPAALDRLPSREQARAARDAADRRDGKVLVSFGGNSRSQNFGRMATTPKLRANFISKLNGLLDEYDFDGVDYNWEYPNNDHEWHAWGDLMAESKKSLIPRGGRLRPGASSSSAAIVTFTMYLDPQHYKIITRYDLLRDADFVHCMAYDQPHQHSTMSFFQSGIDQAKRNHFPLRKFTMGLPFYARHIRSGDPKTYAEIHGDLHNDHDDHVGEYYFNSRTLLTRKTESARHHGIGGVMIWELGQDVQPLSRPDSLMSAVRAGLPVIRTDSKGGDSPVPTFNGATRDDL